MLCGSNQGQTGTNIYGLITKIYFKIEKYCMFYLKIYGGQNITHSVSEVDGSRKTPNYYFSDPTLLYFFLLLFSQWYN